MNSISIVDRRRTDKSLSEFLPRDPEFNLLGNDEIEMLEKIMLVNNYSRGHTFKSSENIYLIIDGDVSISRKEESGCVHIEHMHTGDFFGLFSLFDNIKPTVKCTAAGSVRAALLPRNAFELLFRSNIPLSLHIQQIIVKQLRRKTTIQDSTSIEEAIPASKA